MEHIVPAALGNRSHVLPAGVVCDRCNHYFGSKLEHAVLQSQYFNSLRARQALPSRKGKPIFSESLLRVDGLHIPTRFSRQDMSVLIDTIPLSTGERPWDKLQSGAAVELLVPLSGEEPPPRLFSRFIAKMGFEGLAGKICHVDGFRDFLFDPQFDPIRTWARYGMGVSEWPVHVRRLYPEDARSSDWDGQTNVQVLFEYEFLHTDHNEVYFAICLFGVEVVINVGGADIEGYLAWLKANNYNSPLYLGHNAQTFMRPS